MTLLEIWELSRSNQYTWILPCVLFAGTIAILLSSIIKNAVARRIVTLAFVLAFSYTAIWSSSMAIKEKWRIRHEWGKQNSLTNKEQMRLTTDGANLTMGPLIYGGGYSFLFFGIALLISSVIVGKISRKAYQKKLKLYIASQANRHEKIQIMELPNKEELAGDKPYSLDTKSMLKNFLGKNKVEAMFLCKTESVAEDFAYMTSTGLLYYLNAAFDYLQSEDSKDEDWNFPLDLICSLYCQVTLWNVDKKVLPLIKDVTEYCYQNAEKFDIDINDELFLGYLSSIKNA